MIITYGRLAVNHAIDLEINVMSKTFGLIKFKLYSSLNDQNKEIMSDKNRESLANGFGDTSKEERAKKSEHQHDQVYMSGSRGFSIGELIDRDDLENRSRKQRKNFKGV